MASCQRSPPSVREIEPKTTCLGEAGRGRRWKAQVCGEEHKSAGGEEERDQVKGKEKGSEMLKEGGEWQK